MKRTYGGLTMTAEQWETLFKFWYVEGNLHGLYWMIDNGVWLNGRVREAVDALEDFLKKINAHMAESGD